MKTGALSRKEQQLPGRKRSRAGGGRALHSPLLNRTDESLEGLVSGDWRGMSRKYLHLGEKVWWKSPPRERERERER